MTRPLTPDVGTRSSAALTEARTVLSRAETALRDVNRHYYRDPDGEEIVVALRQVVETMAPFRRTGRSKKSASV